MEWAGLISRCLYGHHLPIGDDLNDLLHVACSGIGAYHNVAG